MKMFNSGDILEESMNLRPARPFWREWVHLEKVIVRNHTKDTNFNMAKTILQTFGANEVDINEFKNLIETPSFMNLSTFANNLQLQSEAIIHGEDKLLIARERVEKSLVDY
jgi:hypothetical protein